MSGAPTVVTASQSEEPPKPLASDTVTRLPTTTDVELSVSVGGGSMKNVSTDDVPPPGSGVNTLTWAVPIEPRSLAGIVAFRLVLLTTVVGLASPFHRTTENASKPVPVTMSDRVPSPARARSGESAVISGAGFVTGVSSRRASKTLMRGLVTVPPARVSVTGRPVSCKALRMRSTPAFGTACLRMAQVPVT